MATEFHCGSAGSLTEKTQNHHTLLLFRTLMSHHHLTSFQTSQSDLVFAYDIFPTEQEVMLIVKLAAFKIDFRLDSQTQTPRQDIYFSPQSGLCHCKEEGGEDSAFKPQLTKSLFLVFMDINLCDYVQHFLL
ncbi:hypothetical protein EXN66_Car000088 [Channa argus]|uniref:Uncharacterized protein n=1 Tax=Channa argus TaxID=215402 RepID=A0A6G1QWQ6_CHAAH|nr:hypothetical protein EXN66_Car000088 [Channa argus]